MGNDSEKQSPSLIRRLIYRNKITLMLWNHRKFIQISILLTCSFFFILFWVLWSIPDIEDEPFERYVASKYKPSNVEKMHDDARPNKKTIISSSTRANPRLFYNRVPKCGSSTLNSLLKQLSVKNNFSYTSSPLLDDWMLANNDMQVIKYLL